MTLAPTTTDRGGETRRRILEVAAEAFAERGYAGTSVNDVLKASGVTKGGFYFHFPSKEALALATLRHKQEQWAGAVMASVLQRPRAVHVAAADAAAGQHCCRRSHQPSTGSAASASPYRCSWSSATRTWPSSPR